MWKQTGQPAVQRHRERWVVRVDGIDTETGRRRPRQVGTFDSRRTAQAAATSFAASGELPSDRDTVGYLVDRWVAGKIDVSGQTRLMYEWAGGHIKAGVGAVRVDRLERDDVARWLDGLAAGGRLSRRSIQILRMVLRAALDDAVATGELRRSPAARVGMPKQVTKGGHRPRGRRLDRRRASPVPRRDRRPPLGGAPSPGGPLRAASERSAGRALVSGRPQEGNGPSRASFGRGPRPARVERREERPVAPDHPDRSRRWPRHSSGTAGSRPKNGWRLGTGGSTTTSSSLRGPARRCHQATSTKPSTGSWPGRECRVSRRTASDTPQRRTWSATPATSARSAPPRISWATAPTC